MEGAASGDDEVDGDAGVGFVLPTHVLGQVLHYERRAAGAGRVVEGARVHCPIHGAACRRFRSLHMQTEEFGVKAPFYWLGSWLKGALGRTLEAHRQWAPSTADLREFIASPDCP